MLKIYKCIKSYDDVQIGTYWVTRPNHFMFQKIDCPSGITKTYKYITPNQLTKYFIQLKES